MQVDLHNGCKMFLLVMCYFSVCIVLLYFVDYVRLVKCCTF